MSEEEKVELKRWIKLVDRRLLVDIPKIDTFYIPYFILRGDISPRISFLYGYNPTADKFIALRVTELGQLLVSGISPTTEYKAGKITVGDSVYTLDLGKEMSTHLIINDGPNNVYVCFNEWDANNAFELQPGEWIEINLLAKLLLFKCNSGETATVRILSRG